MTFWRIRLYSLRSAQCKRSAAMALASCLFIAGATRAQTPPAPESWKFQPMNHAQPLKVESDKALLSSDERAMLASYGNLTRTAGAAQINSSIVNILTGGATLLVLNVEFNSEADRQNFHVADATVLAAAGPFAEIFVKPTDEVVNAVLNAPGIRRIEPETPVHLPPPPVLPLGITSRGLSEQVVSGGMLGLTGKGVIFTIIDSGLDFRNPDFLDFSGSGAPRSRLLYFWDTLSDAFESKGLGTRPPVNFPNGRPIGTLYTRAQLNTELLLPLAQRKIPSPDENGHGTAAASIAVGNGANSPPDDKHIGVAPDADIIAVRIGDAQGTMPEGFLLNAIVEWVDRVAREAREPVVISCSYGGHFTGHDGASVEERHLSARFPPEAIGRAIVISAGNERENAVHAKFTAAGKNSPGLLAWNARDGATVRIFVRATSTLFFRPTDINYDALKLFPANATGSAGNLPRPTELRKVSAATFNPITGEWLLNVMVGRGPGGMELYTASGQSIQGDAYLVDAPEAGTFLETLNIGNGPTPVAYHGEQITSPGTAANAITVGSYDWNDQFDGQARTSCEKPINIGLLSCYSNPGYSRSAVMGVLVPPVKPEIVAPGEMFTASYAHLTDGRPLNNVLPKFQGEPYWQVDHSGRYVAFDGTSAAAPYVAGMVALMMQKKPGITAGEIKNLLRRHASSNLEITGVVPNPSWGYGKLDIAAVKATLNDVR
jgi:subtilisin family serine protease